MEIKMQINNCMECMHKSHSGRMRTSMAVPVCDHPNAVESFTDNKGSKVKDTDDKYHWRHREIKNREVIPGNCPLKNGSNY